MALALALALVLVLATVPCAQGVRVIVIGIDGLGGDWLLQANAPVMKGLMANGTSTLVMQNVIGTSSSQNWFSMVGGAGPDQHGVYSNTWRRGDSVQTPSMFAVVREQLPMAKIGVFYQWDGFGRLIDDVPVLDVKENPGDERATMDAALAWLRTQQPDLLFVHLDHVDGAGHGSSWGSPEYLNAIASADRLVGELVAEVEALGLRDETVIFVSADHGGGQAGLHGRDAQPFRNIPFIVSGPGIRVNATIEREVRVYDLSATVVQLFSMRPPLSWIATPIFEAFRGYDPVSPPDGKLRVMLVSEFRRVYDTTSEISVILEAHSIWRPLAPQGYVPLGDIAVRGYEAPNFSVPVVLDDGIIVRPPIAYERIWTNTQFFMKQNTVSLWQPLPQYGDACLGTLAVPDDSTDEPATNEIYCVNAAFALKTMAQSVARNSGFSTLEYGFWMSLWEPVDSPGGLNARSFIARRDLSGPGYNKFYVLDASKIITL